MAYFRSPWLIELPTQGFSVVSYKPVTLDYNSFNTLPLAKIMGPSLISNKTFESSLL